jgi:hypothetical protein
MNENINMDSTNAELRASSLKPLGQLKPNCPGIIIGRSSKKLLIFMLIQNPRWLPLQDID